MYSYRRKIKTLFFFLEFIGLFEKNFFRFFFEVAVTMDKKMK